MAERLDLIRAKVGKIAFVNTAPFYFRLFDDSKNFSVIEGVPSEINELMSRGEIDFAPISSLEYALHQDQYVLLPNLCIGSRDFSRSVLLLSREKIEGLNHETIVLSKKSLSSAVLLRILLKLKYRLENQFITRHGSPDEMLQEAKAVLAIGDEALFFKSSEFLYKYDLSELWWSWTELPFCFAVWAVRKEFYERHPKEVFDFYRQLKINTDRNLQDLELLLKEGLDMNIANENFAKVFGYLFNLNYYFDVQMKQGLELFYRMAAKAELAPEVKEIKFIEV